MAEKSAPSDALRKLEEQLTCPVCLGHYISPRTLPCFHSFCQQCLERLPLDLQGQKQFLSCPTCRTPAELPEAGVAGFPVAFFINNLSEVHSLLKKGSGDQHVSCDSCKKSDATGYCKLCSKIYCTKCLSVHYDQLKFVDHTVIGINEVTHSSLQPLEQPDITLTKSNEIKNVHKSIEEVTALSKNIGISTGKLSKAIAIYSYEAQGDIELSLQEGQIVEILDEDSEGWYIGRVNGMEGLIPNNYVTKLGEDGMKVPTRTQAHRGRQRSQEFEEINQTGENVKVPTQTQAHRRRHRSQEFEEVNLTGEAHRRRHRSQEFEDVSLTGEDVKVPTQTHRRRRRSHEFEEVTLTTTNHDNLKKNGGDVNNKHEEITVCSTDKKHELQRPEWFFGKMNRSIAEKKLLQSSNQPGTFLIRGDGIHSDKYMLSIRGEKVVQHYRIHKLDFSEYYLLRNPHKTFSSLDDLVKYYQRNSYGLCSHLTVSCPKWEIERCLVHFVKPLHVGKFSEVWEGLWDDTTPVAVKIFKRGTMPVQEFLAEAEVMKKLCHPKVLELYAVCTKEEPIYIITELMTKGDLLNYLRGRHLKLPTLINIGAQVAHGMEYLGRQHYIHRNLAARNVLVGDNNIVKIADFGSVLFINSDETCIKETVSYRFPMKWAAPETFHNCFTIKSDVWSFGVLLYELITHGQVPYSGMNNDEVRTAIQQEYRIPIPKYCPKPLYNIMLDCWKTEPEERPTFEYLHYTLEDYFNIFAV